MVKRSIAVFVAAVCVVLAQTVPAHASTKTLKLFDGDSCGSPTPTQIGKVLVSRNGKTIHVTVHATIPAHTEYDIELYDDACTQIDDSSRSFGSGADGKINKDWTFHAPKYTRRFFIGVFAGGLTDNYAETLPFTLNP